MKPFSAVYYLRNNLKRCIAIILLISTLFACYLGGLYMFDLKEDSIANSEMEKNYVLIYQTIRDEDGSQFKSIAEDVNNNKDIFISCEQYSSMYSFNYESVMGIEMGVVAQIVPNIDEFNKFNTAVGYSPKVKDIKDHECVMTELLANNLGLKVGDTIKPGMKGVRLSEEYKLIAVTDYDGYSAVLFNENKKSQTVKIAYKNPDASIEKFDVEVQALTKKYPNLVYMTYDRSMESIEEDFSAFTGIFIAVIVIVAFILAIAINAMYVGAFEKRRYEFSVLRAIGFSVKKIKFKIFREILLINAMGLVVGATLCFTLIFFLNGLMLKPKGMSLSYYSNISVISTLACDAAILIFVSLLQLRRVKKYTICDY